MRSQEVNVSQVIYGIDAQRYHLSIYPMGGF